MHFKDPHPLTCTACEVSSEQRVADLFAHRAACPHCGASFQDIGLRMRAQADESSTYSDIIEMSMEIEELVGERFSDDEIAEVRTLRDMALLVQQHLPTSPNAYDQAVLLVQDSARRLVKREEGDFDLNAPIPDALWPNRWAEET